MEMSIDHQVLEQILEHSVRPIIQIQRLNIVIQPVRLLMMVLIQVIKDLSVLSGVHLYMIVIFGTIRYPINHQQRVPLAKQPQI